MPAPSSFLLSSRLLFLASLAAAPALFAAEPPAPLVKDTTPVALFNGRNLDGLQIYSEKDPDPASGWKIEDGVLRCLGHSRGYVRTTSAYSDYRLRVEWRWPGKPGNSGVLLHITGPDIIWPKCFEAQLANGRAGDYASFSDARSAEEIVSRNPQGVSTGRVNRTSTTPIEKPAGEWNVYEITVAGDTLEYRVNGVVVNRLTGVKPSAGMIAFQNEGSAIDFRNMELTPLPTAKKLNEPMPK